MSASQFSKIRTFGHLQRFHNHFFVQLNMSSKISAESVMASLSFYEAINGAEEELTKGKGWATHEFVLDFATSLVDDTPRPIDIMKTLGYKTRLSQKKKKKNSYLAPKYWLPSRFSQNSDEFRRDSLVPYFSNAALQLGFALTSLCPP